MAKRKSAKPRRKTKKQASSFLTTIKRMFIGAFIIVACFIGLLFLYNYLYPAAEKQSAEKGQKERTVVSEKTAVSPNKSPEKKTSSSQTFEIPVHAELPSLQAKRQEQVIKHEGYTVSYNSEYRIANWVAYALTAEEARSKKAERSNKFVSDPEVKGVTATNEDYTRTGYDRGHLAPAGDMKWSAKAMRESFYLSNICPQNPGLNRGIWKDLEEQCRMWARDNGTLLIVTGPVVSDDMKRLGKNRVAVPKSFYKVLCYYSANQYKGIAFLFENKDYDKTALKSMAVSIDSVEKVTGIDFFPSLPDEQEKKMEAAVDLRGWSF